MRRPISGIHAGIMFVTAWVALIPALFTLEAADRPRTPWRIRWQTHGHASEDTRNVQVLVTGIPQPLARQLSTQVTHWTPSDWNRALTISVDTPHLSPDSDSLTQPLAGRYQWDPSRSRIVFDPQFPLSAGVHFKAVFRPAALDSPGKSLSNIPDAETVSRWHVDPPRLRSTTTVTQVYPTASVLPGNLLKFYLHFSAPMGRGDAYSHIDLLDSHGTPVELPFLELQEELWNRDNTRLTLIIDPGRIKRGLLPLDEVGPSMVEGGHYTLRVMSSWKDARGVPLQRGYEKHFKVGPSDRLEVNPKSWALSAPKAGTRGTLKLDFKESIDHAVGLHAIQIVDSKGVEVAGEARLEKEETQWSFRPTRLRWSTNTYQIRVSRLIEDLAGNNIGKTFDVDAFDEGSTTPFATTYQSLNWQPRD